MASKFRHILGMAERMNLPMRKSKKLAKKRPEILRYEEMEQRLLFSADAAPGMDMITLNDQQAVITDITDEPGIESNSVENNKPADEQSADETQTELVFVNENVADYGQLISNLQDSDNNRVLDVVMLGADSDGIEQITQDLAARQELAAVHIISHGSEGQINLGDGWLNNTTLQQNSSAVASWGGALSDTGDILFYGCNIAADSDGQSLLDDIAQLTGADVAASEDATGTENYEADWDLESRSGAIETSSLYDPSSEMEWSGALSVNTGTAVWAESGSGIPETSGWDGAAFGAEGTTADTERWRIMQGAESPDRDEKIVVGITDTNNVSGMMWDGSSWSPLSLGTLGTVSQSYWWGADVAYESQSGDALMVWTDGSTIEYATWNSSTWSAVGTLTDYSGATPRQLQLAAHPTSDEMVLVVSDSNSVDTAYVWDGSTWGNAVTLDSGSGDNRTDINVVYQQQGGDAVVVYGRGSTNLQSITWDGSSWGTPLAFVAPFGTTGDVLWTSVAADSNSDNIAVSVVTTDSFIWAGVMDGASWETKLLSKDASSTIAPIADVAFESLSGELLVAYAESSSTTVKYETWSSGGGWVATIEPGPDVGSTPNSLTLDSDPQSDAIMLSVQDSGSDLNMVQWSGSSWGTVTVHETNTGETKNQPFVFLWDQTGGGLTPEGGNLLVNETTTDTQKNGHVGLFDDGSFVTVWDSLNDGSGEGVYLRIFNADGTEKVTENRVNQTTLNVQDDPAVAVSSGGNFVVTWTSTQGGSKDVYARIYNSSGVAQTDEFLVNSGYTTGEQWNSVVAVDDSGNFVVAWQGEGSGDASGVYAQRYDSGGNTVGSVFLVNDSVTATTQEDHAIAMNGSGAFVITWTDRSAGDARISAQRYTSAGAGQGEFIVHATNPAQEELLSSVGIDDSGNFVVAWGEANGDLSGFGIMMQRFDVDGTRLEADDIQVNTTTSVDQLDPFVAMRSDGVFAVSWTSLDQDGDARGVIMQLFNTNGTKNGTEHIVNTYTISDQHVSEVAINDAGNLVVTWEGQSASDSLGVFAQRYSMDPVLNSAPIITSDGGGDTANISVAENTTAVTTVTATDADGDQIEYTITGGADAALFDIDRNTGALTFSSAPDFESPGDANGNNVYEVVVSADDQISTPDAQTIYVTVTNINEGPDQYIQINENTALVATMGAGDSDAPPYGIVGGADAALFQVSHSAPATSFYLFFSAPPNYETPTDSDGDNIYEVTVNFNDVIYDYYVTVKDANDAPSGLPTISGTITEDQMLTVDAGGIGDEDGLGSFSYQWLRDGIAISGATAGTYILDDADVGKQISVQVSFTDGGGNSETVTSAQTAAITGINDAPVLTNGNGLSLTTITEDAVNNGGDLISTILASSGGDPITDADAGAVEGIAIMALNSGNGTWEYNIGSGWMAVGSVSGTESLLLRATDSLRFVPDGLNADTAAITFAAWDQTSGIAGTKVDTSVFGGTTAFSEMLEAAVITVTAVNDAPTITSDGADVTATVNTMENTTAATTVSANDTDGDTPTFSITGGADQALFAIDTNSGLLTFNAAPDFETSEDSDTDNVYVVEVTADDGNGGTDTQTISVRVVDAAEGIRITPTSVVPIGTETLVNTETTDNQLIGANVSQAIAADAAGNYVVVWASNLQDGADWGVYAQLFSADGTAQGSEIQIHTTTTDSQLNPTVAMDDAGNFVVAWQSNLQDGSSYGVYSRYFNSAGVPQGAEVLVNSTTADYQGSPGIAMAPNGDYVVIWTANAQDPDASLGIYGQVYSAGGTPQGSEFRINTYTADNQQVTSVSMDDAGNFVVTWASDGQDGSNYGVFGQLFDSNGVAYGSEFQVNTTTDNSQLYNDVAMLADGRFVVAYQSRNADTSADLFIQRFNADGSKLGSEIQVNAASDMNYFPIPSITTDDSGNFTVVWNSSNDGDGNGVFARSYNWSGTALTGEVRVNTTSAGDQTYPDVVAQPGGGFIVTWGGNGVGDTDGVFMQRYGLLTTEAGGAAAIEVVLESAPTADVVIPISVSDGSEINISAGSLTFTDSDWNTPQTVTVTGLQDFIADGSKISTMILGAATSADPKFNGLDPADLKITNMEVAVPPEITSDGGGDTANLNVAENTSAVTTVTATDANEDMLTFSISGGADQALFDIDANTGVLTFNAAPDFENPGDSDTDNVYIVEVTADDGNGGTDTQIISITVTDVSNTLVVTTTDNTNDGDVSSAEALNASKGADGFISLHEAIQAANNSTEAVTIQFDISDPLVNGAHTITVGAGGLPAITDTVIIDGTTDSDYAGNPVIRFDGSSAGAGVNGLTFMANSDGSVVRGIMITGFAQHGIQVDAGADGITIANNWIGTTGTGSTGVGNTNTGINIQGANTIVGGTGANDGNVITNNGNEGINVTGAGATGTIIQGNLIGLDSDGQTGSGNADVGIALLSGAHNTTIGGTTAAERNVISNNYEGIEINSNNNVVQGNYIGTDGGGTLDRGNRSDDGVEIKNSATGNLIGGTAAGAGNLIAFNALDGVNLVNGAGNSVLGNRIHSNNGLGIDLGAGGVTANDTNDGDIGANGLQNFPLLTMAEISGTDLDLTGSLDTDGLNAQYRIEFYGNPSGSQDATNGEGRVFLGSTTVTTDGSGDAAFSNVTLSGVTLIAGDYVSATATRIINPAQVGLDDASAYGATSEFSANLVMTAPNVAPVLGAIGNQTVDELATLNFTAAATDSDIPADTLTFSLDAASIALSMTIDANTGVFSWTPTEGQGGTAPSVTVTVTDDGTGNLVDSETFTITVNDTNTAPVLGAIGNQTVDELATLSFTATATDSDLPADTLTFSLDAASVALGMTIDANTGAFAWTPTEGQGGTTPSATITVTDDGTGNLVDSETFTITVNDTNTAPVLGAIGNQTVDELATLTFTATATDSDLPADTLTFSLDAASTALGMSLDANTGVFSWTPTEGQGGTAPSVTVTVTDSGTGNLVDSETFTITVNDTNTAPVLGAIGNQTVDELTTLSFTATATDTDLPADTLTFSLDASSVALGMSLDANTGVFSWTPTEGQGGTAPSVTVTVIDSGTGNLVDSETFTITVNDTNTAPVLGAIGNQTVDELATLSFTATATDTDLPADTLTFSLDAASVTLGMTIDANTGVFSWTPTEGQGGTTPSVTITVTDDGTGNLVDSETFTITVNDTNTAPVLGAIGNQTVDELATLSFTATATDTDLPADTLTFSLDAASVTLGMTIDANTGVFSWTPTEGQGGTAPSVTVTVTDSGTGNLVDSETFTITVNDTNTAPVLGAIGNQTVDELSTLSFTATATDSDLPADTLTFSLDAASIALGMSIDANTGVFSWTPAEGQGSTTPSVTITVTDDGTSNLVDSETFTITVNDTNTAPVLGAIGNQTVDELSILSFTATATDSDLPADTLTFSIDAASVALGMTIDANTGVFSWAPTEGQGGTTPSVTITVTDSGAGNLVDSETFTITVNDTNTAPVLGAIGNQTVDELATLSFTASATDSDLPADTLTFSLDGASVALGMTIDANTGEFSWSPTEAQGGTAPSVTIIVTDSGTGSLVDSETFNITVNEVNSEPVLGGDSAGSVTEDVDPDLDNLIETTGVLTVADPDTGESSFQPATIVGTYGRLTIDASGSWNYRADNTQPAIQQLDTGERLTDVLTVTTTDGTTHDVTVTINGSQDVPEFTSGAILTADEGIAYNYRITAADPDSGASLAITASTLPPWLSLTDHGDGTATLSGTPTHSEIGSHSVALAVSDGLLTTTQRFAIRVDGVVDDPTVDGSNTGDGGTTDIGADPDDSITEEFENPDIDPVEDPLVEDKLGSRVVEHTTTPPPENTNEPVVIIADTKTEENQEIIYLVDEETTGIESEERDNDRSHIYRDNDLYKEIRALKYAAVDYSASAYTAAEENSDGFIFLENDMEDSHPVDLIGDFDLLRQEIDESFNTELENQTFRVKFASITAASFTVGIVSFLLRAGSLIASMMSTLPLWRGFDPVAIFTGKKRRKKNPDNISDTDDLNSETLFDGDTK